MEPLKLFIKKKINNLKMGIQYEKKCLDKYKNSGIMVIRMEAKLQAYEQIMRKILEIENEKVQKVFEE